MAQTVRALGLLFVASVGFALSGCNSDDPSSSSPAAASTSATASTESFDSGPVISGKPLAFVSAGTAYSFTPSATDAMGATLSFAVQNKPAWATFDANSGTLSGVPQSANVGKYVEVTITASNGSKSASLTPFTIAVTAAPVTATPLTIAGTPATSVSVGAAYSFKPTVAGPADASFSYTIDNKPAWASFDAASGTLTGTPTASSAGVSSQIVIHVSDGDASAALTAFAITVKSATADSVTLSWTAPTLNADGTPVTDLSGYRVYYGTSEDALNQVVTVDGARDTKQVVGELSSGTWYFAVKSFNTANVESKLSAVLPVNI